MDRRRFLIGSAWAGLATGFGFLAAACAPAPVPSSRASPDLTTPAPSMVPPSPPASGSAVPASPTPVPRNTRIAEENDRRGTREWDIRSDRPPAASGFVSRASTASGELITAHVACASRFDIVWYRLGWYGGDGGRVVRIDRDLPGVAQPPPVVDPRTGLAEAPWAASVELEVPADWMSGMYLAVFRPTVGAAGCAPFVVRPTGDAAAATPGLRSPKPSPASGASPSPSAAASSSPTASPFSPGAVPEPARVLFVSAATTWQAYNVWGGADFYSSSDADPVQVSNDRRAVEVGFDRPYRLESGAGHLPRWELQFVRWQEREGRDVEYVADIDLELHPELLAGRRLVVFAGHHEYWSRPMRLAIEGAIADGVNVAFLSANEVYWQVRFDRSPLGAARRVICYKDAAIDPLATTQPALATVRWREAPVVDAEATLIGQMYGHVVQRPADWIVQQADHWLYEGTGLQNGDRLVNLVGQEYDTYFPQFAHPGTVILAQGPVDAIDRGPLYEGALPSPSIHTATMYTADSGATVFAAGTFQWSWAVDQFGSRAYLGYATPYDERVVRMTRNLFDRLGDGPA